LFTAVTMFIGVGTWAFSALKFQVDMGVLLAFMFLVNLFGAVFLLPALAAWLGVERAERRARGRAVERNVAVGNVLNAGESANAASAASAASAANATNGANTASTANAANVANAEGIR
jgi:hypothetical protein